MQLDLQAVRQQAEAIAREAGQCAMSYFNGPLTQDTKQTPYDIVTEADRDTESFLVGAIQREFPAHHIVGEEGGGTGAPVESADYRWYIDPIDGTTNYVNRIPIFAVSLALTDHDMKPLVSVVYNPAHGELYSAARGYGAALNGAPLRVTGVTELGSCVLGSGFPYDKYTNDDNNLAEWGRFLRRTRGLRRMGSASLDLCYVAAGRFDGYWESRLNPWDYLGGVLCVTEAGGTVSDYQGGADYHSTRQIIASNGHIHAQMIEVLTKQG
ncbi:MAG: inositol monophosphatase family protein [Phototrophicaceae bacterium]